MEIDFARSPRSTVGVEWELMLLDRATGELSSSGPDVLQRLDDAGATVGITGELLTNTIEVMSDPHEHVADVIGDIRRRIATVREQLDPDVTLATAGSHPYAQWYDQSVTDRSRYQKLIERTQWWGRNMMIWGSHVHIGIDDRAKVFPIIGELLTYLPHLLALSTSSPFWAGERTGYASNRSLVFQQLPTAGVPWTLPDWASFERYLDDMVGTGIMDDVTEVRWDIRPAPRWGTVEIRVCDAVATTLELGAIAAFTQCLVEWASRRLDDGERLTMLAPWFWRENKWRAARYGLDTAVIVSPDGTQVPVRDDIERLLETLAPIARDLGCIEELADVRVILDGGPGWRRQVEVATAADGDLDAVVAHLIEEFDSGVPRTASA